MNLVLCAEHEVQGDLLIVTGRRAKHIRTILKSVPGDVLRVGMINGRIGRGEILTIHRQAVEMRLVLNQEPLPAPGLELILALPRPIMLQRILKQATVLGVSRFHLIRSARVEKSFFHSPVLQPEKIRLLLLEALEQAMDTRLPEVVIHHRFRPFVEDVVPALTGQGIIAHPESTTTLPEIFSRGIGIGNVGQLIPAIGPEGGWNDFEIDCFVEQGFTVFSMGSRILHVDTAVVALLAQLQLLRTMSAADDSPHIS